MAKILLLNLPYKNIKLQRDLSCSHSSKADYYWPPVDLIAYSAILSDYELYFIDGVQEKISEFKLLEKIEEIRPDFIFTIISAISIESDNRILRKIKSKLRNTVICASGDLCSFEPDKILKERIIDYVISDFIEKGEIQKIISGSQKKRIIKASKGRSFSIGVPRYEMFKKHKYNMPFSFYQPVVSTITNYGCPFRCKFCNSNNLKFKARDVDEIVRDFKAMSNYGIREVYLRDLTFGIPNLKEILEKLIAEKNNVKWSCEFRVDLADKETLKLMKKAGCYLIFYGGESGNQKTLDIIKKGFKLEQVKKAVELTKKAGIETLMSFIIGFEFENEEDVERTKEFIFQLEPDYVSINVLVPRIGSDYRLENMSNEREKLDNSSETGMIYKNGKSALDYKKEIEKEFFFRPRKLIKYLILSLKTRNRLKNFAKSGIWIFKRV